jgi:hypothetical protein
MGIADESNRVEIEHSCRGWVAGPLARRVTSENDDVVYAVNVITEEACLESYSVEIPAREVWNQLNKVPTIGVPL